MLLACHPDNNQENQWIMHEKKISNNNNLKREKTETWDYGMEKMIRYSEEEEEEEASNMIVKATFFLIFFFQN